MSFDIVGDGPAPALSDTDLKYIGLLLAKVYDNAAANSGSHNDISAAITRLKITFQKIDTDTQRKFEINLLDLRPALRRFAISLTHDPVAADDLVQDTLLRAWRGQASFSMGTNLDAWTFTIMRNQFYSNTRKFREVRDENDTYAAKLTTVPEQGAHLDLQDVRAALARLNPVMREALMLVAVEGMSYEEAATVLDCHLGTVKSRVSRGRDQLERMLGFTAAEIGADGVMLSAVSTQEQDR